MCIIWRQMRSYGGMKYSYTEKEEYSRSRAMASWCIWRIRVVLVLTLGLMRRRLIRLCEWLIRRRVDKRAKYGYFCWGFSDLYEKGRAWRWNFTGCCKTSDLVYSKWTIFLGELRFKLALISLAWSMIELNFFAFFHVSYRKVGRRGNTISR